jgi:hypothetical protein
LFSFNLAFLLDDFSNLAAAYPAACCGKGVVVLGLPDTARFAARWFIGAQLFIE